MKVSQCDWVGLKGDFLELSIPGEDRSSQARRLHTVRGNGGWNVGFCDLLKQQKCKSPGCHA